MIKLYGFELSIPVNRVRLCLNAMGLDYEFVRVNPMAGEHQTKEHLKRHPAGKIPAIDDEGFTLFESNAIMKYLCRKYKSEFYPEEIIAQAQVDQWLDFITNHLANGFNKVLFNKFIAGIVGADVDERSLQDGYGFIKRFLAVIDKQLGASTFVAGNNMTIADFSLLATVDPAELIDINLQDYPNVDAWRNKLLKEKFYTDMHNSFGEAMEKMKAVMG